MKQFLTFSFLKFPLVVLQALQATSFLGIEKTTLHSSLTFGMKTKLEKHVIDKHADSMLFLGFCYSARVNHVLLVFPCLKFIS